MEIRRINLVGNSSKFHASDKQCNIDISKEFESLQKLFHHVP